jgi:hypothetical protein
MSQISITGASTGSATFTIESPATSTNRTLILPDNTGTIVTQNSTPAFASTIGVGGATAAASGAGITFPATQSASTDANTLDDYEEGTWTPTIAFGGSTSGVTYTSQGGSYTKIGRLVYCQGMFILTDNGSGSGSAEIRGLPFTAGDVLSNTSVEPGGLMVYFVNSSISVSGFTVWAEQGGTTAAIYVLPASGTETIVATESYISNSFTCRFFLTYCTA